LPFIICLVIFWALTGCAGPAPSLKTSDYPDKDSGYIYSRVAMNPAPFSCGLGVSLVVKSTQEKPKKEYLVKFVKVRDVKTDDEKADTKKAEAIVAMAVDPGEYLIAGVAFITEEGPEFSRKPFGRYIKPFRVDKGKAYYVGDYAAVTSCMAGSSRSAQTSWSMKSVDHDFDRATADFSRKYIYFGNVEKVSAIAF
jgi:hypothetical protein